MILCIHSKGIDGCAAAAVVRLHSEEQPVFVGVDKKGKYLDIEDFLQQKPEEVYILDTQFKDDDLDLIDAYCKAVVVIDHKNTTDYHEGFHSSKHATCELTWKLFSDEKVPDLLKYIGDFELWREPQVGRIVQMALSLYNTQPTSNFWDKFLKGDRKVDTLITEGLAVLQYRQNYCDDLLRTYGYEADFTTKHATFRVLVLNAFKLGSEKFGDWIDKYQFCVAYIFDGQKYHVNLYSRVFDPSELSKEFGGGGNKDVGNFITDKNPFTFVRSFKEADEKREQEKLAKLKEHTGLDFIERRKRAGISQKQSSNTTKAAP